MHDAPPLSARQRGVPSGPAERNAPLARAHPGWTGLPIALHRLQSTGEEIADIYLPEPLLAVARTGNGKRRYTCGTRSWEVCSAPHAIELHCAGYQVDRIQYEGTPGEVVAVQFPATVVNRLVHDDGPPFDLATRHEVFDERSTDLVFALWSEAASGSPRGALYVQGLALALIGLLTAQHGAGRTPAASRVARFSADERSRLHEFIACEIAGSLCVERLAALVAMSPAHFARVFKATFGRSPHAYVLEQRLELACRALRLEPDRSVADIAFEAGFSSQSHFTDVFRRKIGTTPARWRSRG